MAKIVRLSRNVAVLVKKFVSTDEIDAIMFLDNAIEGYEHETREFVELIEDETCVAFWEALIIQAKKAINRQAIWCMEASNKCSEDGPEWWSKYKEAGV